MPRGHCLTGHRSPFAASAKPGTLAESCGRHRCRSGPDGFTRRCEPGWLALKPEVLLPDQTPVRAEAKVSCNQRRPRVTARHGAWRATQHALGPQATLGGYGLATVALGAAACVLHMARRRQQGAT